MYEACGEGFPEPTEYLRQLIDVTLAGWQRRRRPGPMSTTGPSPICRASKSGRFPRRTKPTALPSPQPHVDLALDIGPLLGLPEHADQLLEQRGVRGREFEPGQEIEGLAEIAAVIELARDGGQKTKTARRCGATCLQRSRGALPASAPTRPATCGSGSAPRKLPPACRGRPARSRAAASRRARCSASCSATPTSRHALREGTSGNEIGLAVGDRQRRHEGQGLAHHG